MWTIEDQAQADIASDLSAFHRVDDPMSLDGPLYFQRANRLGAYSGVIQARALKREQDEREGRGGTQAPYVAHQGAPSERPTQVPEAAMLANLADGWVEHTTTEEQP